MYQKAHELPTSFGNRATIDGTDGIPSVRGVVLPIIKDAIEEAWQEQFGVPVNRPYSV